jgi:hypothetical protein
MNRGFPEMILGAYAVSVELDDVEKGSSQSLGSR